MNILQIYLLFFISLTTSASSAPIYARPRCQDTCGNLKIPYPFGIGANCYLNEWYSVDCNSSVPYLSSINNLRILGLNLDNQTVTVNVSIVSDCQTPVRNSSQILSLDLGGSPFLFSSEHNKFTVEGCGNAVVSEQGNVLTGCSTICQNQTLNQRNNCYGINCCQTTIPYYLKTYSVDITGLERRDLDGVCGTAFLVDENFYSAGRFSEVNNSFVPIALKWTMSSGDITACSNMGGMELDLGNGTTVESYVCSCQVTEEGNPYLYGGCQPVEECVGCSECQCTGDCRLNGNGVRNYTCIQYSRPPIRSKSSALGVILGNNTNHIYTRRTYKLRGEHLVSYVQF